MRFKFLRLHSTDKAMVRRRDPIYRVPRVGRDRVSVDTSGRGPHPSPPVGRDKSGPYAHSAQNYETNPGYLVRAVSSLPFTERVLILLRRLPPWTRSFVLLLPAVVWYAVFFLGPLWQMVLISFAQRGPYGGVEPGFYLDSYQELTNPLYVNVFAITLKMALIGTLACLVIGYPLAYFLATRAGRYKTVLLLLIIVPFWTSFLIRTYAWETILDSQGVLSNVLQAIGVIHQPLQVLYSPVAIFIGIVYNYLPLMVFPLYVALERMDKRLVEASKDLGAGRFATFRQVTLPLTLPGVMTGCLLVFIPLTGEYLIPTILGGSKNIFMGSLIANQFLEVRDWPFGAALGVMVMVLLLVLVNIYLMVFRRVQSVPGL